MKLWQKNTIKELLEKHKKSIKKSLGQNYLLDYHTLKKIAQLTNEITKGTIIEVGPGLGGLTQVCLSETNHSLIAVEIDHDSFAILNDIFFTSNFFPADWKNRLTLINQDILDYHIPPLTTLKPFIFIGNLPYHLATTILLNTIERYHNNIQKNIAMGIFMVQKEVAEQLLAKVNDSSYGIISVLSSAHGTVKKIKNLTPNQFYPSPTVTSTVISFTPHDDYLFKSQKHYQTFKEIVKASFGYRRKKIENSLKLFRKKHLLQVPLRKFKNQPKQKTINDSLLLTISDQQLHSTFQPWLGKRAEQISTTEYVTISEHIVKINEN